METYLIKITDIHPSKYNPRVITDQELSGLKESIKKFGFVEPLIVNKKTNTLVGGHQRLKAAELLGFTEVPITYVDLSESEEKALNIALNTHTIQGKFDNEILSSLLEEIKIELPELLIDLNFDKLEKDLGLGFTPDADFSHDGDDPHDPKKFQYIECPSCKEVFEKSQAMIKYE